MDNAILARVYALVAEIESIKIEIIGMQAENKTREMDGLPHAYNVLNFDAKAAEMRGVVGELNALGGMA